ARSIFRSHGFRRFLRNSNELVFPFAESPLKNLALVLAPIAAHLPQMRLQSQAFVPRRQPQDKRSTRSPCSLAAAEIVDYSRQPSPAVVCPGALERPPRFPKERRANDGARAQLSLRVQQLRQSPAFRFPTTCSRRAS